MIKLILFSCVTLTLINCSLSLESSQLINGDGSTDNYVQRLKLRFKRSAGKSSSSSMASASSSAVTSDGLAGGPGGKGGLTGFGGLDGLSLDSLNPEKLFSLSLTQLGNILGGGQGEASLSTIIDYLKKMLNKFGSSSGGNFGQLLLNGDLSPKIKQILSSTAGSSAGSSSGSSITKLLSNFANPSLSSSLSSAQASSSTGNR